MKNPKKEPATELERMTAEHATLTRLQYEALQKSSYARMSESDAEAYDQRVRRIIELHGVLTKFRRRDS